jgi:hypothetical protein
VEAAVTLITPLATLILLPTLTTPSAAVVAVATLIVPLDTPIFVPTFTIPNAAVVAVGKSAALSYLKAGAVAVPLSGPANTKLAF